MLGWSGRHEPDFRAQHRWRGFDPTLLLLRAPLSLTGNRGSLHPPQSWAGAPLVAEEERYGRVEVPSPVVLNVGETHEVGVLPLAPTR
jgi:hypothetical protein